MHACGRGLRVGWGQNDVQIRNGVVLNGGRTEECAGPPRRIHFAFRFHHSPAHAWPRLVTGAAATGRRPSGVYTQHRHTRTTYEALAAHRLGCSMGGGAAGSEGCFRCANDSVLCCCCCAPPPPAAEAMVLVGLALVSCVVVELLGEGGRESERPWRSVAPRHDERQRTSGARVWPVGLGVWSIDQWVRVSVGACFVCSGVWVGSLGTHAQSNDEAPSSALSSSAFQGGFNTGRRRRVLFYPSLCGPHIQSCMHPSIHPQNHCD